MASNLHSTRNSTIQGFDSDSADNEKKMHHLDVEKSPSRDVKKGSTSTSQINLLSIGKPLSHLRKVISSATNLQKMKHPVKEPHRTSSRKVTPSNSPSVTRKAKLQDKIEQWSVTLRAAINQDANGMTIEAFEAYRKFNRQITKDVIMDFQLFTCDQQKLLNRLLVCLDRRCRSLQTIIDNQERKTPGGMSPSSSGSSYQNAENDNTFSDLNQSVGLLSAIKAINSSKKMPVVLVYREKRHRIRHRHQEKGKSNKIIFPTEKRTFLQVLGLPGKMITEQGIDFSVEPDIEPDIIHPRSASNMSNHSSQESTSNAALSASGYNTPDKTNGITESDFTTKRLEEVSNRIGEPKKDDMKLSLVDHCINFKRRFSISPLRTDEDNNGNAYKSRQGNDDLGRSNRGMDPDAMSTLSCDTCSSNESSDDDFEEESHTDTAVLSTYFHKNTLLPAPFRDDGATYVVLMLDKVGVNKSSMLSPFLRVSLRDEEGTALANEQETAIWEVKSRNYLMSRGSVYIQESLETLPDDTAIFFEIRHFLQDKRKLSTHCYTFIEKSYLKDGEFVCEIYRPPVDFTRKRLIPYSEKALFFHLEIKVEPDSTDHDSTDHDSSDHDSSEDSFTSTLCSVQT